MSITVTEITDPGCIWSWSSVAKLTRLRAEYGDRVTWRRVFGVPGPRAGGPAEQHANWRDVVAVTGAPIAAALEYVATSSVPESLAARAAERQGEAVAEAVLLRLREATFLEGRPPHDTARIREALSDVPGLDLERLLRDADDADVVQSVLADRAEARKPPAEFARADGDELRFGFPTLIIRGPGGERILSGWTAYEDYVAAIEAATGAAAVTR